MSHICNSQDVMDVEKTVSPKILRGAPKERPWKDWPVLRWRTAGRGVEAVAWVASPRERRAMRVKLRANMVLVFGFRLVREEREDEVAEVTVHKDGVRIRRDQSMKAKQTHSSRVF